MKFNVGLSDFKKALQNLSGVVATKSTLPILETVYMRANKELGTLLMKATNLEQYMVLDIQCNVEEDGECCVPHKTFTQFIGTLSDDIDVSLQKTLSIKSGKATARLNVLNVADFPMAMETENKSVRVNLDNLKQAFAHTMFAVSQDNARPQLTAVCIDKENVVATDGFRLSVYKHQCDGLTEDSMLIPINAVKLVTRLMDDTEIDISSFSDGVGKPSRIGFLSEHLVIWTQLIDGKFPAWERIIPTTINSSITLDAHDLSQALNKAQIFTNNSSGAELETHIADNTIVVRSPECDNGNTSVTLPASMNAENDITIQFNLRYVKSFLDLCKGEVTIKMIDERSPIRLFDGDDNWIAIFMPMKF